VRTIMLERQRAIETAHVRIHDSTHDSTCTCCSASAREDGSACALRWAVGSSGCVGAVARVRRFRPEKSFLAGPPRLPTRLDLVHQNTVTPPRPRERGAAPAISRLNTRRTASKRPIVHKAAQRLTNAQSQARSTVVYHHYDDCLANWDAHDPSTCSRRGAGCRSASSHCSRARASKDADRRGDGGASGSQGGTFEAAIAQGTNGCQGTFRCGLPNGKAGGCQGSFVVICWSGRLPSARRCWWLELGQSIHRFVSRQAHRRPIKALPHAE
jgi:hypothetical protein